MPTPEQFLEARTIRGVSIKTAAKDIGLAFSGLIRWNRGETLSSPTLDKIASWIAETPQAEQSTETWRPIPGWEGFYEASDLGNVRSVERKVSHPFSGMITIRQRRIKTHPHPAGHRLLMLSRGGVGRGRTRLVHTLILQAFVGPRPDGMDGCHNDGNPANNRLSNLRWDTPSENMLDRIWHEKNPGVVRPEVVARLVSDGSTT